MTRNTPIGHIIRTSGHMTVGLRIIHEQGWLDGPEATASRRTDRWLLFSTCSRTLPFVHEVWEPAGSDDSLMQPDPGG